MMKYLESELEDCYGIFKKLKINSLSTQSLIILRKFQLLIPVLSFLLKMCV